MNKIGHNQPPVQLDDFLILNAAGKSTGRIKFTNTIIKKYLIRKLNSKQEYVERIINDSEKIGLKAKINLGGSKSFYYKYDPKGKTTSGKRRNPVPYHLGNLIIAKCCNIRIIETKSGAPGNRSLYGGRNSFLPLVFF